MNFTSLLIMSFLFLPSFVSAQENLLSLHLSNCTLNGDTISNFDNRAFSFRYDYDFETNDTLKLELVHYRITAPLMRITWSFTSLPGSIDASFKEHIKAGDGILFRFSIKGKDVLIKNFHVATTTNSLNKPYYYDVYFIYNEDTVAVNKYILATRMKMEKRTNVKRIFFSNHNEISRIFYVIFNNNEFEFEFEINDNAIYHGRITFFVLDKENLIEKHGFEKSVEKDDLDLPGDGMTVKEGLRFK